jgi:hypothetical protein
MLIQYEMKKYILLLGLCCFGLLQSAAAEETEQGATERGILQDSIRIYNYKGEKEIGIPDVHIPDFTIPDVNIPDFEIPDIDPNTFIFSFNMDSGRIPAWKESIKNSEYLDFSELKESLKGLESPDFSGLEESLMASQKELSKIGERFNFGKFSVKQDKTPKSVENKTFANISEIEFFQKYGNIVVKESKLRDVELEIRYFGKSTQNLVNISSKNGLLSIDSRSSNNNQVDFIISVPRNVKMNVDLKYGHMKMDDFRAAFSANFAYSSFDAGSFSGAKPVIRDKYGKIAIGNLQDIDLSASYSKVKIGKADRLDLSGSYSDYVIGNAKTISVRGSSISGDFKIGSLGSIDGKFNYADMDIDNLVSGINMSCNYSDIKVNSISNSVNINIKGNYSDVMLNIPENIGASFGVSLLYGDLIVSKKHTVTYTEQSERSNRVVKKGRIGSKNPTVSIDISNNYSDVKIK